MEPITGIVEKKVAESLFDSARKWLTPNSEMRKELEVLKAQVETLKAQLNEKEEFKREVGELDCRPEDDNIYWAKNGAAFCPLCIRGPEKLLTPLTNGMSEGSYYCRLHQHYFETRALRERRRGNYRPQYAQPLPSKTSWMR